MSSKEAKSWKKGFLLRACVKNVERLRNERHNTDLLSLETQHGGTSEERPFLLVSSTRHDSDETLSLVTDTDSKSWNVQDLLHVQTATGGAGETSSEPSFITEVETRKRPPLQTDVHSTSSFTPHDSIPIHTMQTGAGMELSHTVYQNTHTATTEADHSTVRQQWASQLSMTLLRIRQSLGRRSLQTDGVLQLEQQKCNQCQKIASQFVEQIIQNYSLGTAENDETGHSFDGGLLLYDVWDQILPSIGDIGFEDIPLNYSIPSSVNDSTHVNFYGLAAEPHILTLPPAFYLALSLLQHESGNGWISILEFGQRIYKLAYTNEVSRQAKNFKVQLLGLSSIIILQSHICLASFHPKTHDMNSQSLHPHLLPSTIIQGLVFFVDLACVSSDHGKRNTLLTLKAQEASCTLVELLSFCISASWGYHPGANLLPNQPDSINLDKEILCKCYNSLERLLDLSRTLALPDKDRNIHQLVTTGNVSDCDFLMDPSTELLDKVDPHIHCRLALINFWFVLMKRFPGPNDDSVPPEYSIKDKLFAVFHKISLSNDSSGSNVGRLTCDLCRISRFPRVTADTLLGKWRVNASKTLVNGDEKLDEASTDLFIKSLCLALSYKGATLNLRNFHCNGTALATVKLICSISMQRIDGSKPFISCIPLAVLNSLFQEIEILFSTCTPGDNTIHSLVPIFHEEMNALSSFSSLKAECPLIHSLKRKLIASVAVNLKEQMDDLLGVFLSHFDLSDGHIDVLLSCLKNTTGQRLRKNDLSLTSCFFTAMANSAYLQMIVERDSSFIFLMPVETIICGLLELLPGDEMSSEIKTLIPMRLLLQFLEDNISDQSEKIADNLVRYLTQMERSANQNAAKSKSFEQFCNSLSECFSLALLSSEKCGDNALGLFLRSIGLQLIDEPSNRVPISLLSASLRAIVDSDACQRSLGRRRFTLALNVIIEMAVGELETIYFVKDAVDEQEYIFKRLAPLLILRCIPQGRNNWVREEVLKLSPAFQQKLATVIINSIGINAEWAQSSAHEKRLFAEIAARYLPFSKPASSLSCCIEDIITPVFTALEFHLKNMHSSNSTSLRDMIKKTKIWIYSICHFVAFGPEHRSPELKKVINFAICLSDMDMNQICGVDDWIQLQMGCIELVSLYKDTRSKMFINEA